MKLKELKEKITSIYLGYGENIDVVFPNEDGSFDFNIALHLHGVTFEDGTEKEIIIISSHGDSTTMTNERCIKLL